MSTTSNNLLIKNLTDFGLSDKEAKIYLALLELEIAPVQDVAKVAGINRSSAYVVLESLKKQGLVSVSDDKKIQQYIATPPEVLLQTAESRSKNQLVIKERIADILPDLKALYKGTKQKPKIRVFEGRQGLINALEEILNNKEKIFRIFSSGENIIKILSDYLPDWAQRRCDLNIMLQGICVDNPYSRALMDTKLEKMRTVYVPKEKYPSLVDMVISDDAIGYLVADKTEITTIVLESREIAVAMKGIFDSAWKEAKDAGGKLEEWE